MKWFKHDSNANRDAKLKKLMLRYGLEGYGLYWYCLELIAEQVEKENLTFELEHDAEIIAHDTRINVDQIQSMMTYMVDLGLFENNVGAITCMKMAMRLDDATSRHPAVKEIKQLLGLHNGASPTSSEESSGISEESPTRLDQIRLDKKDQNTKGKTRKRFSPPSLEEVAEYIRDHSHPVDPNRFIDHYTSNGWRVGKNPMKDWKAAVRTWANKSKEFGNEAHRNSNSRQTAGDTIDGLVDDALQSASFVG